MSFHIQFGKRGRNTLCFLIGLLLWGHLPISLAQETPNEKIFPEPAGDISIESEKQTNDPVKGVFTAIGNVRIVYPTKGIVATSRKAEYFKNEGMVVLTGNVDLVLEGGDSLKGERIIYMLEEDHFMADSKPGSQVFTKVLLERPEPDTRLLSK